MNCRKVSHLLSAYMDGELPGVEHRHIHTHLIHCAECRDEYESLLLTKRLVTKLRMCEPQRDILALLTEQTRTEEARLAKTSLKRRALTLFQQVNEYVPSGRAMVFGAGFAVVALFVSSPYLEASEDMVWSSAPPPQNALLTDKAVPLGRPVNAPIRLTVPQENAFVSHETFTTTGIKLLPETEFRTSDPIPVEQLKPFHFSQNPQP